MVMGAEVDHPTLVDAGARVVGGGHGVVTVAAVGHSIFVDAGDGAVDRV